jgi:hypothetical protein
MPKRLIYCLLLLGFIVGLGILMPAMQRKEKENDGSRNTVSVAPGGFNALFRLLKVTNKEPIRLWRHSLMLLDNQKPQTMWLMEPDESFFYDGSYYVKHLRSLVSNGSNLIFIFLPNTQDEYVKSLNQLFGLKLSSRELPFSSRIEVSSHFPSRNISQLSYSRSPESKEEWLQKALQTRKLVKETQRRLKTRKKFTFFSRLLSTPVKQKLSLMGWNVSRLNGAEVLLETTKERLPLVIRLPYGKGSITVFANSQYLENSQLDRADNAALAVALSERNASPLTLFEVHSAGFDENRDIVSYLATSRGVLILITLLLGLAAFCVWLSAQPIRKKLYTSKSDDRFFTQEVFIDALANHYKSTQNWGELYEKFSEQLRHYIEQKMPSKTFDEQLMLIAQNPFYEVTLADLKTCFESPLPSSEADFLRLTQHLLTIQKKVNRYEQSVHFTQSLSISTAR